jgi:polysaccharide export outer membrane protein
MNMTIQVSSLYTYFYIIENMSKDTLLLFASLLLASCVSTPRLAYLSETSGAGQGATEPVAAGTSAVSESQVELYDARILPKDLLRIFVFSPYITAAAPFNEVYMGTFMRNDGRDYATGYGGTRADYLVDNEGNVDFPLVGRVHLAGLTKGEAEAVMKEKIRPYMNADFTVNVWLQAYSVSVFGEVRRPGMFSVGNQKINVLEALAMAGDMTVYGRRDNVKLVRTRPDGEKEIHTLDFTRQDLLESPYYYLQQRDILYVEPNESRKQDSDAGPMTRIWLRGVSILVSVGSLMYRALR